MKRVPTLAAELTLARKAANALIRWRRNWEYTYVSPPSLDKGHENELPLWAIAGRIMKQRGIKRILPG